MTWASGEDKQIFHLYADNIWKCQKAIGRTEVSLRSSAAYKRIQSGTASKAIVVLAAVA